MNLFVWPSEFGLPSIDPECLQFMAASKLCAAPITFVPLTQPWKAPSGDLPYFEDDQNQLKITRFEKFVDFLRNSKQDIVLDNDLIPAQLCEFDAYNCLLRQRLRPALLQIFWLDSVNYQTVTHFWYASKLWFPYNQYYTDKKKKLAKLAVDATKKDSKQLTQDAIQVLNLLSAKLADNKYFCGDKPCSLDALVFGYLAPLLRVPLPSDRIQIHLVSTPNLVRFVESILSIYLPLSESQLREQVQSKKFWAKRKADAQKKLGEIRLRKEQRDAERQQQKTSSSNYDIGYFVAAAVTVSVLFAVHFGLLPTQIRAPRGRRKQIQRVPMD